MPADKRRAIESCVRGKLSHVKIYEAQQHSEKYQLVFHEKENDRQGY